MRRAPNYKLSEEKDIRVDFRYHIPVEPLFDPLGRNQRISIWGSCFAEELQRYLWHDLYRAELSPFGIMYNPISMADGLTRVLQNEPPRESELFEHLGAWHSFMYHGDYSHHHREVALEQMQRDFGHCQEQIEEVELFIFTFGTAYIYELSEPPHSVVNNCHKVSGHRFRRRRVSVSEIYDRWLLLLQALLTRAPRAKVLFTVSPICHYRDGAHENRLSKSVLLLAIEELITSRELPEGRCFYFPSYEIMLDELRDYRFFKSDMTHPTEQAVAYIMSRFRDTYLQPNGESTLDKQWKALSTQLGHRPISTNPEVLRNYYGQIHAKVEQIRAMHNHPYLVEEQQRLEELIRKLSCQNID